jgi:hypothetical protein
MTYRTFFVANSKPTDGLSLLTWIFVSRRRYCGGSWYRSYLDIPRGMPPGFRCPLYHDDPFSLVQLLQVKGYALPTLSSCEIDRLTLLVIHSQGKRLRDGPDTLENRLAQRNSHNADEAHAIDSLPYPSLEPSVRTIQSSLQPGSIVVFEFTTIAADIPFLSDQFVFCCLPFMPRRYLPRNHSSCRTSTPLLASLHRIIEVLSSGPSNTTIKRITNVTTNHVTALHMMEQSLVNDQVVRLDLIRKWGVEGWREHRIMIAWEAGLLSAGYLQRWNVIVRK